MRRTTALLVAGLLALAPIPVHARPPRPPRADAAASLEQSEAPLRAGATQVTVVGEPGALLYLDEQLAGALPLATPLLAPPGRHRLRFELGAQRASGTFEAAAGRALKVRCMLSAGAVVVSEIPTLALVLPAPAAEGATPLLRAPIERALGGEDAQLVAAAGADGAVGGGGEPGACADAACLDALARRLGVRYVLLARALAAPDGPALAVELFDGEVGEVAARAGAPCPACAPAELAERAAALATQALHEGALRPRGRLELDSDPAGAQVLLDGRRVGTTPYRRAAWAGAAGIALRLEGHAEERRQVTIEEGQSSTLRVPLRPVAPPPLLARRPPPPPPAPRRPLWRLLLGGAAMAAGAGVAAGGAVTLIRDGACAGDPATLACPRVYDTAGLGIGLIIGGAFLAGTGAALVALPPSAPRPPQ